MAKEGECFDKRGVPIYRGDLFKGFHFQAARKKYWLYHVAVLANDGNLEMVPASYLDPGIKNTGGRYWLTQQMADSGEVIQGYGPGKICDYEDRPRRG